MRVTKDILYRNSLVKSKELIGKEKLNQIVANIKAEKLKKLANELLVKDRLTRLSINLG